jgi:polyisoprenoid-binding protein YceI
MRETTDALRGYLRKDAGSTSPKLVVMLRMDSAGLRVGTWTIDSAHSRVGFSVRHLMVATVHGRFTDFDGTLTVGERGLTSAAGLVRAASVATDEPKRDERLRGPSFFDTGRYPLIPFRTRRVERAGAERFRVIGDLTIKEVARPLVLEAALLDGSEDPSRIDLAARGAILRSHFGLSWSEVLEAAGALVSDRVEISMHIVATRSR